MNKCLYCGKEILFLNRIGNQPKLCCEEHRRLYNNAQVASWKRDHPERRWMPDVPKQQCPVCLTLFSPTNKGQIYCSASCRSKFVSRSQVKPLPACERCGQPVKRLNRRFCSRECKVEWYKGENVHSYVGEKFRKDAYPVDYAFWMKLSEEIRERDKVCQSCGKTPKQNGRALDVHHKIPYRISQDNSPSNLVALCKKCHKKADHEYNDGL